MEPLNINSPTINNLPPSVRMLRLGTAGGTGQKSESPMFTGLGTAVRLFTAELNTEHGPSLQPGSAVKAGREVGGIRIRPGERAVGESQSCERSPIACRAE